MRRTLLLPALLIAAACGSDTSRTPAAAPSIQTGEGRLAVDGGSIWYRVTGTGHATPVVLLHGGPGFSSYYLKPFEDLGSERKVIRYDQLGGGRSGTASDTSLFNIGHFVAELDSLRSHLGVTRWHVIGHSWGTILALEYYRAHPDHVASITFGSPVFDVPAFTKHASELVRTLSDSSQRAIRLAESTGKFETPQYQAAFQEFMGKYVTRHPVQADLDSSFAQFNQTIYVYMQGPSEFTITGTLKNYDVTGFLPSIAVPTLVTVGEYDEVGPELVRRHAAMIPGARFEMFPGSAHMTPWDARDSTLEAERAFLRAADERTSSQGARIAPGRPLVVTLAGGRDKPGLFAQRVTFATGSCGPLHTHDRELHGLVLRGTLLLGVADSGSGRPVVREYTTGDFIPIPAGRLHVEGASDEAEVYVTGVGPVRTTMRDSASRGSCTPASPPR
jgi:proline iminopeptidase